MRSATVIPLNLSSYVIVHLSHTVPICQSHFAAAVSNVGVSYAILAQA